MMIIYNKKINRIFKNWEKEEYANSTYREESSPAERLSKKWIAEGSFGVSKLKITVSLDGENR